MEKKVTVYIVNNLPKPVPHHVLQTITDGARVSGHRVYSTLSGETRDVSGADHCGTVVGVKDFDEFVCLGPAARYLFVSILFLLSLDSFLVLFLVLSRQGGAASPSTIASCGNHHTKSGGVLCETGRRSSEGRL